MFLTHIQSCQSRDNFQSYEVVDINIIIMVIMEIIEF